MKKKIRLHSKLLFLLLTSLFIGSAQNSGPYNAKLDWDELAFSFQEAHRDSLIKWQERVVLHLANKHLNEDTPLFFKAYLLIGVKKNRFSFSGVLNVELRDDQGEVLKKQFHKVVDGMVEGHMKLPEGIKPGKYQLLGYTRWMRNYGEDFFAKEDILVGGTAAGEEASVRATDVEIKTEGGPLLSNYENRILIKFPETQTVQFAKILDENRQEVAKINLYANGIGSAIFKPATEKEYQLELENGATYRIPKAEPEGYLLHVNNLGASTTKIRVTASSALLENSVKLIGTSSGVRYFEKELNFKEGNVLNIELPKIDIPYGLFTLKLVGNKGTELVSRPIWIEEERLQIDIEPVSNNSAERVYRIKVSDEDNSPVKTQLAFSANRYEGEANKNSVETATDGIGLFAYPEISESGQIAEARKKRFAKDLEVLLSENRSETTFLEKIGPETNIRFFPQKGLELSGYAYDLDNKLLSNTKIQIMAQTEETIWFKETETDADGLLRIEDMPIDGTVKLVARTKGNKTSSKLVKLTSLKKADRENQNAFTNKTEIREQEGPDKIASLDSEDTRTEEGLIKLKEVEVIKNPVKTKGRAPSVYGVEIPKTRIRYQDPQRPRSLEQMLLDVPGVIISGIGDINPIMTVMGVQGPILWVLDGLPLAQAEIGPGFGAPARNSLVEIKNLVPAGDIERIELLKGPEASMYGARAAGGVMAIYTRSGKEREAVSREEAQSVFVGYEPIVAFEPLMQSLSENKYELSNLLYWNPKLETDENGEAIVTIPLASQDPKIKIEVSTITPDGKIGVASAEF